MEEIEKTILRKWFPHNQTQLWWRMLLHLLSTCRYVVMCFEHLPKIWASLKELLQSFFLMLRKLCSLPFRYHCKILVSYSILLHDFWCRYRWLSRSRLYKAYIIWIENNHMFDTLGIIGDLTQGINPIPSIPLVHQWKGDELDPFYSFSHLSGRLWFCSLMMSLTLYTVQNCHEV